MFIFVMYYSRYLNAGVNITPVGIIVSTAVLDSNKKCGKEARKALNLCVNVIFSNFLMLKSEQMRNSRP